MENLKIRSITNGISKISINKSLIWYGTSINITLGFVIGWIFLSK